MSDDETREPPPPSDRRSFLRRLTGEAVQAAGTLAGASSVVMRSATAASEAAANELGLKEPAEVPAAEVEIAVATPKPEPAPAPGPPAPLRPLTARESELLTATTAIVAINTLDGTPQLTRAPFHWDGETARMLGRLFGARIANVQRDGRISVLVEDARGWLTLIGDATVATGPAALGEAAGLLARDQPDQPAETAWATLNAAGDQAVIVLRPRRIVSVPG